MKLIKNVRLVLTDRISDITALLISDRIINWGQPEELLKQASHHHNSPQAEDVEIIDGEGMYLSPGFIDIHIHGAAGFDTMDGSYQALNGISKALLTAGVTSFLPTTMTMPADRISQALLNVRQTRQQGTEGARILGAHAEGPFINPDYKGAQMEKDILLPDPGLLREFYDLLEIVTLAPEREGAEALTKELTAEGIVVSAGHSGANFQEIISSRQWGVSHTTHLFNAMTGLHHRRPGIVGAALSTDLTVELIADFIHLHPAVLQLVLRAKDPAGVILITDQIRAGSLGDGVYDLGGQQVTVLGKEARLENGSLAGSVLTLNQAVKNILEISELPLYEVIKLVTLNPARRLGREDSLGRIARDYRADLVLFDREIKVKAAFVGGTYHKII